MDREDKDLLAFFALGDPTRWSILELLAQSHRSVREVASRFSVSRPAISKHLRILREAGLVVERQMGRERIQEIVPESLESARQRLANLAGATHSRSRDESQPGVGMAVAESWRCW
jgi:DNA-binding transcriptional ArsR family regulator